MDYDGLKGQDAVLSIYNVNGNAVYSSVLPGNARRMLLHAGDLANGVYMYKATVKSGKIIILK